MWICLMFEQEWTFDKHDKILLILPFSKIQL